MTVVELHNTILEEGDLQPSGYGPRVLTVTKMWPTTAHSMHNGFLKLQVESLRRTGVSCDVLVTQRYGSGPRGYLATARAVRSAVAAHRYDVIHAHYGLTGISCLSHGLPVVLTLHGSDIYGSVADDGHKTVKGRAEAVISRVAASRAKAVVVVSHRMASLVPWVDPIVIPIGIDTELFCPIARTLARRELGLDEHRPYVLFAANPNNPVKRYQLAKRAVDHLRRHYAEVELLAVHGEPLERMPLWMSAANVLLITSSYEGGPMVHREAMACGLPIVSVDVGDVAIHLKDVSPSEVVAAEPEALAEGLRAVIADGRRANGRSLVEATSTAASATALRRLYLTVADSRPKGSSRYGRGNVV